MSRRTFFRPSPNRPYRSIFVIATEGTRTEPAYFGIFNNENTAVKVKCLAARHGRSPQKALKDLQAYLEEVHLKPGDEAWLVIDRDSWALEHLDEALNWSKLRSSYGVAISNPKFEYWLLLHFEDGSDIASPSICDERLKRYLPDYRKNLDIRKINIGMIHQAVSRAKERDVHTSASGTIGACNTTVYKLVAKILAFGEL